MQHKSDNGGDMSQGSRSAATARHGEDTTTEQGLPDVVRFEPITGLVLACQRGRRSRPADSVRPAAGVAPHTLTQVRQWWEGQRRHLANHGRPRGTEKRLVCRRSGHALLWLVDSPWGLVPVARTAQGGFRWRASEAPDGRPLTLEMWPAGEFLPIGSCRCHDHVEISVHEARRWREVSRDKFVYSP